MTCNVFVANNTVLIHVPSVFIHQGPDDVAKNFGGLKTEMHVVVLERQGARG